MVLSLINQLSLWDLISRDERNYIICKAMSVINSNTSWQSSSVISTKAMGFESKFFQHSAILAQLIKCFKYSSHQVEGRGMQNACFRIWFCLNFYLFVLSKKTGIRSSPNSFDFRKSDDKNPVIQLDGLWLELSVQKSSGMWFAIIFFF